MKFVVRLLSNSRLGFLILYSNNYGLSVVHASNFQLGILNRRVLLLELNSNRTENIQSWVIKFIVNILNSSYSCLSPCLFFTFPVACMFTPPTFCTCLRIPKAGHYLFGMLLLVCFLVRFDTSEVLRALEVLTQPWIRTRVRDIRTVRAILYSL